MKRWYVVHTKSGGENLAVVNLGRQGFTTYCPLIRSIPPKLKRVPLFPRYLFVELDIDAAPWRCVNGTIGVTGLVQFGPRPSAVPDGVVEELMKRENDEGLVVLPNPVPRFRAGDRVVVSHGPFVEQLGVVNRMTGAQRAELLLQFMGRQVKVTAPLNQVSVA